MIGAAASVLTVAGATGAGAQSIFDTNARTGPQYVQYTLKSPVGETISEWTVPLFVVMPVSPSLTFDVGTSYTSARVAPTDGASGPTSTISGLTDTQVRANYSIGTDFVVLTAGVNIPTGRETADPDQALAAFRIGNDFLSFPISNFGTGFGFTGGVALARPLGSWNLGVGGSVRHSASYEPFEASTGDRPRFEPGNEYRARVGVDHPFGTGRFAIGVTYSTFGDDNIGGSIYNTGDRFITQAGFTNSVNGVNLIVNAWDLHRGSGTILSGVPVGSENIANVLLGVGFRAPGGLIEPSVELRNWTQRDTPASVLGTLGLRYTLGGGGVVVTPSAGYTVGRFATSAGKADLSGFRASLSVRLGP